MLSDVEYRELYVWTKEYIDRECIIRRSGMPGKAPGTLYSWIFYLRNGLFNHEFSSAVSQLFLHKKYKEVGHFNFQITGLETGTTPLLVSIPLIARAFNLSINSFSVRKEQKKYGLLNWVEGLPNSQPVMIVDDLCNSSMSMKQCYDILRTHNIEVMNDAFCLVNKVNKNIHQDSRQVTDMYLPEDIKIHYLFDLDDFNLYNPSH